MQTEPSTKNESKITEIRPQKREAVIFWFSSIENVVNNLLVESAEEINSDILTGWVLSNDFRFSDKIRVLRFICKIDEDTLIILKKLANIRNKMAHSPFFRKDVFTPIHVGITGDSTFDKLPDDFSKFLYICNSQYASLLLKCKKPVIVGHISTHDFSEYGV